MSKNVKDVQLAQVFREVFNAIQKYGEFQKPNGPRMGGIWSADTYILGDYTAMLADDGYSNILRSKDGKLNANITFTYESDHTINFFEGDEQALRDVAMAVMKLIGEKERAQ
jgi:hypothetical protein